METPETQLSSLQENNSRIATSPQLFFFYHGLLTEAEETNAKLGANLSESQREYKKLQEKYKALEELQEKYKALEELQEKYKALEEKHKALEEKCQCLEK